MVKEQEKEYWRQIVSDLQDVMTVAEMALELDANERQVWRWKSGADRPMGMMAIKVYLLHVKRCPERQCPVGHYKQ